MSNFKNGRIQKSPSHHNSRTERLPYNQHKKAKYFTRVHSLHDNNISYRSTPEYLRQLMNASMSSNGHSARTLKRTHSASDLTSMNDSFTRATIGKPKYKTQEDYYDEVQLLKKELKRNEDDNNTLRARVRRLEEDNARKKLVGHPLTIIPKTGNDTRRMSTSYSNATNNLVLSLKQRLFKLESQLRQKETMIEAMKTDPRWTKGTELEIKNRALFNELEKQKLEKLNLIHANYTATINEEQIKAIRKLEADRQELKKENNNLRKRIDELENKEREEHLSTRRRDLSAEKKLRRKVEDLKELCSKYRSQIDQMNDDIKHLRRELNTYRDKYDAFNEDHRAMKSRHELHSSPARKQHHREWTSADDIRLERFRRKRAANVIQRSWRKHKQKKSFRESSTSRASNSSLHKWNTKNSGNKSPEIQSPRLSRRSPNIKSDSFERTSSPSQSPTNKMSTELAITIIQASLRGHTKRLEFEKKLKENNAYANQNDYNYYDMNKKSQKQYGLQYESNKKRDDLFKYSKPGSIDNDVFINDTLEHHSHSQTNTRQSNSSFRRPLSPVVDPRRSISPRGSTGISSKQALSSKQNQHELDSRRSKHEKFVKHNRSSSPSNDHRSSRAMLSQDFRSSSENSNKSPHRSPTDLRRIPKTTQLYDEYD